MWELECMAKELVRLNKRKIEELEPDTSKRVVYWDDQLKGFGVRVEKTGRKSFIVRYRPGAGGRAAPQRELVLGQYGPLSADQGRQAAKKILAEVAARTGADPAMERRKARRAETVNQLFEFYLDVYAPSVGLRKSTVEGAETTFRLYVKEHIGAIKVADVGPSDLRRLHSAVFVEVRKKIIQRKITKAKKLRKAQKLSSDELRDIEASVPTSAGRYQANRVIAVVSKAMSLAVENGWRLDNPAAYVKALPEDKRERYLSDDEIRRFLTACDAYEDQHIANAFRLLLFTGARLREVLEATWDQFDLEAGVWTKPSSHTKQKKTHRLELEGVSLDILRTMRAKSPFLNHLFPGASPVAPRRDLKRPWDWIKGHAKLEGVRIHDLRHTLASVMISTGTPLAVIGKALGHTQPATTARYAHIAEKAQREATKAASEKFVALLDCPSAEVIFLKND
jgi:integrase